MKLSKQTNIFSLTYFYVLFYIFVNINTKVVNGYLPGINPTSNGRRFDAAKDAMNLITTVDLPSCRCVNIFASGSQQCEVPIPARHLRILNIDCQKLLRCRTPSSGSNFGVCCRRRQLVKPYVTPADLSQFITTLRRLGNARDQQEQCNPNLITNSDQSSRSNPKIYVTPAHTTSTATTTKKLLPTKRGNEKGTTLTNLLIQPDQLDNAAIRLAADVMGTNTNLDPNNFQLGVTNTSKQIVTVEKVVQDDTCTCVASSECPTKQMNFRFGKSCKMGDVRCCSPPTLTTPTTDITTSPSTSPISIATTTHEDTTTRASTIVATNLHQENSTSSKAIKKPNTAVLNHRPLGHETQSLFGGQESSPYRRYSIPSKNTYIYRAPMRRPPQFYERLNNNAHAISHTERPRYHPNDGRFHTFQVKEQQAQNRNLQLTENEEVTDVPKLVPAIKSKPTNIKNFENNNNPRYVQDRFQPPRYVNRFNTDIRQLNEHQQRMQNPSLLQRFQNFLIGTGQVLTQSLG